MSTVNNILESLHEGMLTTIKSKNVGIFSEILRGKIQTQFTKVDNGNIFRDTRAERIVRRREIASKKIDNKIFCDMGDGYVLVVFHSLPVARGILLDTGNTVNALANTISKTALLPKDYKTFCDKVPRVFKVVGNVMYNATTHRVCNKIEDCIQVFFKSWFIENASNESVFKEYLIDTGLANYIEVTSAQIGFTYGGLDGVLSFSFKVLDESKVNEIKNLSNAVDSFAIYEDVNGFVIDFYILS